MEKRGSASSYTTIPLAASAKLIQSSSVVGGVVLYPLFLEKGQGLADIFRPTIPGFHNEYESSFDHSSS